MKRHNDDPKLRTIPRPVCQAVVYDETERELVPAGESLQRLLEGNDLSERQLTTKIPRPYAGRKSRRTHAAPWTRPPVLEA